MLCIHERGKVFLLTLESLVFHTNTVWITPPSIQSSFSPAFLKSWHSNLGPVTDIWRPNRPLRHWYYIDDSVIIVICTVKSRPSGRSGGTYIHERITEERRIWTFELACFPRWEMLPGVSVGGLCHFFVFMFCLDGVCCLYVYYIISICVLVP